MSLLSDIFMNMNHFLKIWVACLQSLVVTTGTLSSECNVFVLHYCTPCTVLIVFAVHHMSGLSLLLHVTAVPCVRMLLILTVSFQGWGMFFSLLLLPAWCSFCNCCCHFHMASRREMHTGISLWNRKNGGFDGMVILKLILKKLSSAVYITIKCTVINEQVEMGWTFSWTL